MVVLPTRRKVHLPLPRSSGSGHWSFSRAGCRGQARRVCPCASHRNAPAPNEAIYEAGYVKPPVQGFCGRGFRTFPSPSVSVDLSHLSLHHDTAFVPPARTFPEPEVERDHGGCLPLRIELRPTRREPLNHLFGIARTERRHKAHVRRTPPFIRTTVDDGIAVRLRLGVVP